MFTVGNVVVEGRWRHRGQYSRWEGRERVGGGVFMIGNVTARDGSTISHNTAVSALGGRRAAGCLQRPARWSRWSIVRHRGQYSTLRWGGSVLGGRVHGRQRDRA